MTPSAATIIEACEHPALFQRWFRVPEDWRPWFAFLRALFGLPMDEAERQLFRDCTGRDSPPAHGFTEAWLIVGRRGGKSFIIALIAVYLACFREWAPFLVPGERGTIMIIATDRRQARTIFRYMRALLLNVPPLAAMVERETDEAIDLTNGVSIEIASANFRGVRGYTIIAALLDEIAFWRSDDSANPDTEILAALRPAMATVPGAMLIGASSPYARRGVLYDAYRRHSGRDSSVLAWKASTRVMNPTVPQATIDEETERDPASAAAEYGAEFRQDVETFLSREVVEAAIAPGRHELAPVTGIHYVGFVDPSGGSGGDSFTLAIAHRDRVTGCAVLDVVRERRPPFSPEAVVQEYATLLKEYGVRRVTGDRWGGEFPRERFRLAGIEYDVSEKPKSEIYRELLPMLNSGRVELLDLPRLTAQLCGLERRTARGGRDSIDHAPGPGAHDDIANSAAGALLMAGVVAPRMVVSLDAVALMAGRLLRSESTAASAGSTRITREALARMSERA